MANYQFTILNYPGSSGTQVYSINDSGVVAGLYFDQTSSTSQGFTESGGTFTPFAVPGSVNQIGGINESGQVAGSYEDNNSVNHAFVESNGAITNIDPPGASGVNATGINASGQVVGWFEVTATAFHGFLESNGSVTTLDAPGAVLTFAEGINDLGQVVGYEEDSAGVSRGFLYDGGVFTTVDVPGASVSTALGINASGQIVGNYVDGKGVSHGFVDSGGTFTTLDFPGARTTKAYSINASGAVSGDYQDSSGLYHAFVENGGVYTQITSQAYPAAHGLSINAAGQVAGFYVSAASPYGTGYVASPLSSGPPTISGLPASEAATGTTPISPFAAVTVTDPNGGATETLTITQTGAGTLSGSGLAGGAGSYTLTGTADALTAALQALSFTPAGGTPGSSSTTGFTLADASSAGTASTPVSTTITDTVPASAPVIAGTHATSTTAEAAVTPFSGVTLADPNAGATDTLTIQLSSGGSGGTLTGNGLSGGQNGVYILGAGAASDVQNQLQALVFTPVPGAPGTQSSTGFTLTDQSSAGTSVSDGGTSVTDIDPPAPVDTTLPTVVFDANVTLANANTAIFTGTVSDNVGVAAVTLFEGDTALGNATVNPDGTWSFTADFPPGFHTGISAVATDTSGNTSSAPSDFDLTTGTRSGIPGQPYRTIQDRYDPDGNFLGQTFFKANGAVLFSSDYAVLPNGDSSYTYSGGSFFKGKDYSSFVNIYDPNGTLIEDIENKRDGSHLIDSHYIEADPNGQTVHSIHNDTFANNGANERFVFSKGFGHDTIAGFRVGGSGHDTIVLPSFDAAHLAQIIAHAQTDHGDTTFQVDKQDSITLTGVTKKQLEAHLDDFKFHA